MADLRPELFAADVRQAPHVLAAAPPPLDAVVPLAARARRVLFLGMGSSRFAALDAAAFLRAHGIDAHAELASTGSPQPPSADTLVLAVSATGGSQETLTAMRRHLGTSMVVGVTSRPERPIGAEADVCVEIAADGPSGVACASHRSTVALLRRVCGVVAPAVVDPARAADAAARLIEGREAWLPRAVELVADGPVHVLAPAERLGAAEQSALMLREVPRIPAYACETGDWAHVDVYLTKRPGYRALVLTGSAYEAEVMEWAAQRRFTVVAVGGPIPGATLGIELPGAGDPAVRPLVETLPAELLAAELWARTARPRE
jgi:glutamine---fructose-6-phosphate transaminase (isomerizing)